MPNAIFQMSADARLLLQHLDTVATGETATYEALSAVVSRQVKSSFPPLQTALRRLLKDRDKVFAPVRGVGLRRLSDADIVDDGGRHIDAIRRKARRTAEKQSKADFNKLDRQRQATFSAQMSIMGAVAMMTRDSDVRKVANAMTPERRELPVAETLKMFV